MISTIKKSLYIVNPNVTQSTQQSNSSVVVVLVRSSDQSGIDCPIRVYMLSGHGWCHQGTGRRGRLERLDAASRHSR